MIDVNGRISIVVRIIAGLLLTGLLFAGMARAGEISEQDLLRHIEILASDDFEGRKPGTVGENKTVNYIATQWNQAGLQPAAADGSWYGRVSLVERTTEDFGVEFTGDVRGKPVPVRQDEIILRSRAPIFRQSAIPVLFAGYADPPAGRAGLSVAGKLVILSQNPPVAGRALPDHRQRKRQLIADGALAVISIIPEQRRWPRFQRFFERGVTTLDGPEHHAEIEGMISFRQFRKLLRSVGQDPKALLADSANIAILDLGMSANVTAKTKVRSFRSHNVIGKIAGHNPQRGALLFMGHWDHFGLCRAADPMAPAKDRICNGAVDNASGISLLIETANRLSRVAHARDIYFLATTAEEKGLLGARAFVENPPVPLASLVAVFNADTVALAEQGDVVAAIGLAESGLAKEIAIVAEQEGREIDRSGKSDVYLRRQDGYMFLERAVPALMITSAFADDERLQAFINGAYHDVSDEVNDSLELGGAAADANFHVALGHYFASTETYPGKATSGTVDN